MSTLTKLYVILKIYVVSASQFYIPNCLSAQDWSSKISMYDRSSGIDNFFQWRFYFLFDKLLIYKFFCNPVELYIAYDIF